MNSEEKINDKMLPDAQNGETVSPAKQEDKSLSPEKAGGRTKKIKPRSPMRAVRETNEPDEASNSDSGEEAAASKGENPEEKKARSRADKSGKRKRKVFGISSHHNSPELEDIGDAEAGEYEAEDGSEDEEEIGKSSDGEDEAIIMSERGKTVFTLGIALLSPLLLALAIVILGSFALMYIGVILVDIALALAIALGCIAGIVSAVIAIIYGVTGILPGGTESYIGFYEIGLGLIIIGVLLIVCILVYHFIIKVTPIGVRSITRFFKFTFRQIKRLFIFVRKECGKL